jgi:hypothetical protein
MLLRSQARLIARYARLPKGVRYPRAPFSLGDVEMISASRCFKHANSVRDVEIYNDVDLLFSDPA